jgi:crossover junction endodeoxyribonuclease RusA
MFRPSEDQLQEILQRGTVKQASSEPVSGRTVADGQWFELPLPPTMNDYWRHPGFNLFDRKVVEEIVRVAHHSGVQGLLAWARRRVKGLHQVSVEGKRFKRYVAWELRRLGVIRPAPGRLRCEIVLHCRTATSDIDNRLKALFDALQHAGAYKNDNQIDDCHFRRGAINKAGKCFIRFFEIPA